MLWYFIQFHCSIKIIWNRKYPSRLRGWSYSAYCLGRMIINDKVLKEKEGYPRFYKSSTESSLTLTRVMKKNGQSVIMKTGGPFEVSSFWNTEGQGSFLIITSLWEHRPQVKFNIYHVIWPLILYSTAKLLLIALSVVLFTINWIRS